MSKRVPGQEYRHRSLPWVIVFLAGGNAGAAMPGLLMGNDYVLNGSALLLGCCGFVAALMCRP